MLGLLTRRTSNARIAWLGLVVSSLLSVAWVWTKPVVLDECVLGAQVLAGAVKYPPGHPNGDYYFRAWSTSNVAASLIFAEHPSPLVLSKVRNGLSLFLSLYLAWLVGGFVSGRLLFAVIAMAFTTTHAAERLYGVYPTFVYPTFYSNGHIGLHVAVLAVVLIAGGFRKSGALLLGLLPGLHASMAICPLIFAAIVCVIERRRSGRWPRRELLACAVGLAITGVLLFMQWRAIESLPAPVAPYDLRDGADLIVRNFTELTDIHRLVKKSPISLAYGFLPLLYFALLAFVNAKRSTATSIGRPRATGTLSLFGVVVLLVVYGAWGWKHLAGALPWAVEMTMPMRFSNDLAILVLPLLVGVLGRRTALISSVFGATALMIAAGILAGGSGTLDALVGTRFMANEERSIYGLIALFGVVLAVVAKRPRWRDGIVALLPVVLLAVIEFTRGHPDAGVGGISVAGGAFVATLVVGLVAERLLRGARSVHRVIVALAFLIVVVAAGLAAMRHSSSPQETLNADDMALAAHLSAHVEKDAMLVAPLFTRSKFQIKSGHPTLCDLDTLWMMSYLPRLAPSLNGMLIDIYGVDYRDRESLLPHRDRDGWLAPHAAVFRDGWMRRTPEDWRRIKEKYGARYVISRPEERLALSERFTCPSYTLYEIE